MKNPPEMFADKKSGVKKGVLSRKRPRGSKEEARPGSGKPEKRGEDTGKSRKKHARGQVVSEKDEKYLGNAQTKHFRGIL